MLPFFILLNINKTWHLEWGKILFPRGDKDEIVKMISKYLKIFFSRTNKTVQKKDPKFVQKYFDDLKKIFFSKNKSISLQNKMITIITISNS